MQYVQVKDRQVALLQGEIDSKDENLAEKDREIMVANFFFDDRC